MSILHMKKLRMGKGRKIILFMAFVLGIAIVRISLDENISKNIYMIAFLILGSWMIIKGLEMPGIPELFVALGIPFIVFMNKILASSKFAKDMSHIYNLIKMYFCDVMGIHSDLEIGNETSIAISFGLVFAVILLIQKNMDHTAMKVKKGSDEQEFKQKNYAQKSEMFCQTLRQRLETINRETDWNENLFTPIQAEVEINIKGKRKKRCEDLLKCLKSIRHRGAIFLVLGEPGAGKSVSLRKLCLELLDESKKTKKIPIYINLKKWNKDWNLDNLPGKKDLIDFIKEVLYENGDIFTDDFLKTYFDKMLEDGRWYFVFDSFDEMPCLMGKQNCQELIDKISELLWQFMTGANQSGGVIASRLYKSPSEAVRATVVLKIQEFNDIKIKTMLQKYLNNANEVVKELFGKRENLVVLCRNPFYLTLLINYIRDRGVVFPKNQMELYQNFVGGRLKKCSEKFEKEKITIAEVYDAAKKLAVFMHNSSVFGLECPITELFHQGEEQYWRRVLKLLDYAKICRFGGENEAVSFVHRRFQEFFFVESIIESGEDIEYEEYQSIVNNASMRDALVLYCEVIEEEKAKKIAEYCWKVIQKNSTHLKNIQEAESLELVNILYFMTEAFRNRKSAIVDFKEEFEQFIEESLKKENDFVVLLALTNCMVLLEQKYLQKMILKVFQLKNRWLNDVVVQNCRILNRLDNKLEMQFVDFFLKMNIKTFLKRFNNMHFSFSLLKVFWYVKIVHFMIFLAYVLNIGVLVISGIFMLFNFNQYIILFKLFIENFSIKTELQMVESYTANSIGIFNIFFNLLIYLVLAILLYLSLTILRYVSLYRRISYWTLIQLLLIVVFYPVDEMFGITLNVISNFICILLYFVMVFHELYGIIKQRKFKKIWNRNAFLEIFIFPIILSLLLNTFLQFIPIIMLIGCACLALGFAFLAGYLIVYGYQVLHDYYWIRNQIEVKRITRECLDINLKTLYLQKYKKAYIESLIQQKVQLSGQWSDNRRPNYKDDEIEFYLAKLDCLALETYNYLF